MYCKNCGTELPDGTRFCSACGAQLDSSAQPAPAYQQQQNAYQPPAYQQQPDYVQAGYGQQRPMTPGAVAHPEYQNMGGWLLFFTILMILGVIGTLVTIGQNWVQVGQFAGMLGDYGNAVVATIWINVVIVVLNIYILYLIFKRKHSFLRVFQIVRIASLVLSLVMSIVQVSALDSFNYYFIDTGALMGPVIGSLVVSVVVLILMTMYFCKSARVEVYMGGDEFRKRALFRVGTPNLSR